MKRLDALLDPSLADVLAADVAALPVAQLAWDVRDIRGPALVAVWRGKAHDGHAFLAEAKARGAVCALVQRSVAEVNLLQVVSADPRRALARAARRFYGAPDARLTTVAITGTNGKTTTAALIAHLLAAHRGAAASIGTLGIVGYGRDLPPELPAVHLTTPEGPAASAALATLHGAGFAAAVLEASSMALAQGRLDGVQFDVAAWTNLSQDHLDDHGDMARYGAAKARLFAERLKPHGTVVQNADDAAAWAAAEASVAQLPASVRRLAFSAVGPRGKTGQAAQVWAQDVRTGRDGTQLTVVGPKGRFALHTPLVGAFNVENLLLALTVALALEVPPATLQHAAARFAGVPGRLERILAPGPAPSPSANDAPLVLVDYAHTPDALCRLLEVTRALTPGRLWCVFGCGGGRDPTKRAPMGAAVGAAADCAVLTNDNPRAEDPAAIAAAVVAGLVGAGSVQVPDCAAQSAAAGPDPAPSGAGCRTFCVQLDRRLAIRQTIAAAGPGDTVVVAGKGHETVQIVGAVHHPFDDRAEGLQALRARQVCPT